MRHFSSVKMQIAFDKKGENVPDGHIQFRTPLTSYAKMPGKTWVLDNGAFTMFDKAKWLPMAKDAILDPNCLWFAFPDEVGDSKATSFLFRAWYQYFLDQGYSEHILKRKAAYVVQDGITIGEIPWPKITAVFIGGSTKFKLSRTVYEICELAQELGKYVHVGRVNTPGRATHFHGVADTIDGTGMSKYSIVEQDMIDHVEQLNQTTQTKLFD